MPSGDLSLCHQGDLSLGPSLCCHPQQAREGRRQLGVQTACCCPRAGPGLLSLSWLLFCLFEFVGFLFIFLEGRPDEMFYLNFCRDGDDVTHARSVTESWTTTGIWCCSSFSSQCKEKLFIPELEEPLVSLSLGKGPLLTGFPGAVCPQAQGLLSSTRRFQPL